MNKWQKLYCEQLYEGRKPRTKAGKIEFELLGQVKERVIVEFPEFGERPAHTETYTVTENDCDMPNGKISVSVLAANLSLWVSRGYKIKTY